MNLESKKLSQRLDGKAVAGLAGVKFAIGDKDEATSEIVCGEVNRLYDAADRGEVSPLAFRDSHRPNMHANEGARD